MYTHRALPIRGEKKELYVPNVILSRGNSHSGMNGSL